MAFALLKECRLAKEKKIMSSDDKGSADWLARKLGHLSTNKNTEDKMPEKKKKVSGNPDTNPDYLSNAKTNTAFRDFEKNFDVSLYDKTFEEKWSPRSAGENELSNIFEAIKQIPEVVEAVRSNEKETLNLRFKVLNLSANIQELTNSQNRQFEVGRTLINYYEERKKNLSKFFAGILIGAFAGLALLVIFLVYRQIFPSANSTQPRQIAPKSDFVKKKMIPPNSNEISPREKNLGTLKRANRKKRSPKEKK